MGVRRVVAFGRRHTWPVTMAAVAAIAASISGFVLAWNAWTSGWYLAGYFGGAVCGDVFIWAVLVLLALWLPRKRAHTA